MSEKELYEQVLGLHGPWRVGSVEPRLAEGEILIHVSHGRGHRILERTGALAAEARTVLLREIQDSLAVLPDL